LLSCEDRKGNLPFLRTNKLFHRPRKSGLRKKGWTLLATVRKETKREVYFVFKFETDCIPNNQTSWFQGAPEERNRDWPTHFNV
jgi:hypothetical protein